MNLGPVGGRIVAETLIGLLRADPASYLNVDPRFKPFLARRLPETGRALGGALREFKDAIVGRDHSAAARPPRVDAE